MADEENYDENYDFEQSTHAAASMSSPSHHQQHVSSPQHSHHPHSQPHHVQSSVAAAYSTEPHQPRSESVLSAHAHASQPAAVDSGMARSNSSLSLARSSSVASSTHEQELATKDDVINKLKQTNATLRLKLKEFNVLLDKSIQSASNGQIMMGSVQKQPISQSHEDVSVLQGEIRNLHKKLEIYRKNNDLMRRQLESVGSADHTISLENALAEKQMQIDQLTQELRTCKKALTLASKDGGTREAVEQAEQRMLAVVDENRVLKERLRDNSIRLQNEEKTTVKTHEQLVKTQAHARLLEEKLRASELKVLGLQQQLQSQQSQIHVDSGGAGSVTRLQAEIEEYKNKLFTMTAAKNLAEQDSKKWKSELKSVQSEVDQAQRALHESQIEVHRLSQINASLQLRVNLTTTTVPAASSNSASSANSEANTERGERPPAAINNNKPNKKHSTSSSSSSKDTPNKSSATTSAAAAASPISTSTSKSKSSSSSSLSTSSEAAKKNLQVDADDSSAQGNPAANLMSPNYDGDDFEQS